MTRQSPIYFTILAFIVMLVLAAPQGLLADITATPEYSPAYPGGSPWVIGGDGTLQIGIDAQGQVTVTLGSVIDAPGVLAVGVLVTGGPEDLGELMIQSGGQVTAGTVAYVGGASADLAGQTEDVLGGTGRVTVTGSGSSLTVGSDAEGHDNPLFVGYTGQGTLSVESQATATTRAVVVGGGPHATGHVIVDNATLDANHQVLLGVWAGNASPNTVDLTVRNGGQVTTEELRIGGTESSETEFDADLLAALGPANGSGTANVETNGRLDVTGAGYIGYAGTGTVNVRTGGAVTTYQTALGIGPASEGTLTVDGATVGEAGGAQYHVAQNTEYETDRGLKSGALIVGGHGTGTATVENGGQMAVDRAVYVGGYKADELPFASIDGTPLDPVANGTGTLTVQGQDSSLTTPVLAVGATGTGHLYLYDNASLTTQEAGIGVAAGSHGDAVVSNTPGSWANSGAMFVGGYGTGSLSIQPGGHVDAGTVLYIGGYDPGDITSASLNYGDHANGTGTVTVTGSGSALITPQLEAFGIGVGVEGNGTLRIENGGRADSQVGVVGNRAGGIGTVVVDGDHSLWNLSGDTEIPGGVTAEGSGAVTVSNGGAIQVDGSNASLVVGTQETEDADGQVTVGSQGQGTLTVANGGRVISRSTVIGGTMSPAYETVKQYIDHQADLGTGTGTVTLTGQSRLYADDDVFVGLSGNGTLNVTDSLVWNQATWLGFLPNVTGEATISGGMAEWTNLDTLTVGMWGTGTFNIENGAYVSAQEASIGGMPFQFIDEEFDPNLIADGTGTVNVTGEGSTLEVGAAYTLYVGYSGTGTLNVQDQGNVYTQSLVVGGAPDAVGTVAVSGEGSTLTAEWDAQIGAWGAGNLIVSDGGAVSTGGLRIGGFDVNDADDLPPAMIAAFGPAQGSGRVVVTGEGSTLDVAGEEILYVGSWGTGTLDVNDGGAVTADFTILGHAPDALGTATVRDANSVLTSDSGIIVGAWGTGDLTISNGGRVETSVLHIGGTSTDETVLDPGLVAAFGDANGVGHVTVTGPNSVLEVYGEETLVVGGWGTGALTIEQGGTVTSEEAVIGGYGPQYETLAEYFDPNAPFGAGTGTVTVAGAGSTWQTGNLEVGFSGNGTLRIENGGQVSTGGSWIGVLPDAVGTVQVSDANSVWQTDGELVVGVYGEGNVTIENGAYARAGEVFLGGVPFALMEVPEDANHVPDGTGTLTVTGAGSTLDVVGANTLYVGYSGDGTLNILNGGRVETDAVLVGVQEGATGRVTVDGQDSTLQITGADAVPLWAAGDGEVIVSNGGAVAVDELNGLLNVAGTITVGSEGTGSSVTISDGARVYSHRGVIGGYDPEFETLAEYFDEETVLSSGTGSVTIDGSGSRWDTESLMVGFSGSGTLTVSNGGRVMDDAAWIGVTPDASGHVTVSSGSRWISDDELAVGVWGSGTLDISGGSQVWAEDVYLGGIPLDLLEDEYTEDMIPRGTGVVNVSGAESALYVTQYDSLYVGLFGDGTLNVTEGGYVQSDVAGVAVMPGSTGSVTVDGAADGTPSTWQNDASLFVGGYGTGELTVSAGGLVDINGNLYVGGFDPDHFGVVTEDYDPDGTGTVTVTGEGSTLYGTGLQELYVGYSGTGTLDVNDGGYVESGVAVIGALAGSTGAVTVHGTGAGEEGSPSTWENLGSLVVGGYGSGSMVISEGGEVHVGNTLYIGGFDAESESFPTVEGLDPNGTGTVNVTAGGRLASGDGFIGYLEDSTGTVNVTGTDSQWNVDGDLFVGGNVEAAGGTGLLNVGTGGLVDVLGEMTIWETGTLTGSGTVTVEEPTTLRNYGKIAPGSAAEIGTLTVNGHVVFEPGSTYAVKIGPTSSDKLEVNGDVTINGGTVEVHPHGTIVGTHDYEIVKAQTVEGTFDVLDTTLLNFTVSEPNLSYTADTVNLHVVAANFDDPDLALTRNERAVAGTLQDIADEGGNDATGALQGITNPDDLRHAYDQLSGQTRPPLGPLAISGTSKFLSTVSGRAQTLQTGLMSEMSDSSLFAMSGPDSSMGSGRMYDVAGPGSSIAIGHGSNILADRKWGVWGRGYGLFGDRETETGVPGYTYKIYGGSLGLDYQFTDTFLAGVVLGISDGTVDFAGTRDNADFQAMHIGVYDSLTWDKWYLDSVASYADLGYDTERFVDLTAERLTGDLNGYELSAYVEAGYNWDVAANLLLQPLASLQYTYLNLDSYTETGGPSALSYDDQTFQSVKGSLGARLTRQLLESANGFRAEGQLRGRWVHEFGDNEASVDTWFASNPASVFTIHDAKIARDSALLGAGLSADLTKQMRAYVDYDTRLNSDETVHVISAALQYRW